MRRSWWLFMLAACGTDRVVPVDATLDLDDAFGTGIDAPPDAPPAQVLASCTGKVTGGTRMGADKFGGAIMTDTPVSIQLLYDPGLSDEQPGDPKVYEHAMIGDADARLALRVPAQDGWEFATTTTTNCRIQIANDNPGDSFVFGCIDMSADPVVMGETAHRVTLTFSDATGMLLTSDRPPVDVLDVTGLDPAPAFLVEGQTYTWSGTIDSCQ